LLEECFSQAAARHLHDAKVLKDNERWDNAVYLAGYVVECSFKVLVQVYIPEDRTAVKKYGHDLTELQSKAMDRLRLMYPVLDMQLPASRTTATVLDQYHPERRYAKSGLWNQTQAQEAVNRAEQIYQEVIPKLILDGILSSEEL
jgi:HEPN domain-containing protein